MTWNAQMVGTMVQCGRVQAPQLRSQGHRRLSARPSRALPALGGWCERCASWGQWSGRGFSFSHDDQSPLPRIARYGVFFAKDKIEQHVFDSIQQQTFRSFKTRCCSGNVMLLFGNYHPVALDIDFDSITFVNFAFDNLHRQLVKERVLN